MERIGQLWHTPITGFLTIFTSDVTTGLCWMAKVVICKIFFRMSTVQLINSVSAYNQLRGVTTLHPLVSVIDAATANPTPPGVYNFNFYGIFLKELKCGELRYGRGHYDYQEGTLVFLGPGQVIGVTPYDQPVSPKGWALLFHPDLVKGTHLGKVLHQYSFFSYAVNEALHLSEKEKRTIVELFEKIREELENAVDRHSKTILTSNLEVLLNYANRFYERQFITRDHVNKGIAEKFESLLHQYFHSDQPIEKGFPTVSHFAHALQLSTNYFGDLIKKETGLSPQEHIQAKMIDVAKERIFDFSQSIAQIGQGLGFKYPQHFTRIFRQKVGITPSEYRNLN